MSTKTFEKFHNVQFQLWKLAHHEYSDLSLEVRTAIYEIWTELISLIGESPESIGGTREEILGVN